MLPVLTYKLPMPPGGLSCGGKSSGSDWMAWCMDTSGAVDGVFGSNDGEYCQVEEHSAGDLDRSSKIEFSCLSRTDNGKLCGGVECCTELTLAFGGPKQDLNWGSEILVLTTSSPDLATNAYKVRLSPKQQALPLPLAEIKLITNKKQFLESPIYSSASCMAS